MYHNGVVMCDYCPAKAEPHNHLPDMFANAEKQGWKSASRPGWGKRDACPDPQCQEMLWCFRKGIQGKCDPA